MSVRPESNLCCYQLINAWLSNWHKLFAKSSIDHGHLMSTDTICNFESLGVFLVTCGHLWSPVCPETPASSIGFPRRRHQPTCAHVRRRGKQRIWWIWTETEKEWKRAKYKRESAIASHHAMCSHFQQSSTKDFRPRYQQTWSARMRDDCSVKSPEERNRLWKRRMYSRGAKQTKLRSRSSMEKRQEKTNMHKRNQQINTHCIS